MVRDWEMEKPTKLNATSCKHFARTRFSWHIWKTFPGFNPTRGERHKNPPRKFGNYPTPQKRPETPWRQPSPHTAGTAAGRHADLEFGMVLRYFLQQIHEPEADVTTASLAPSEGARANPTPRLNNSSPRFCGSTENSEDLSGLTETPCRQGIG
jgi:hypothetical protein